MPIKINVGTAEPTPEPEKNIRINIVPETMQISLQARKTLDGNIMILDHMHMDIILNMNQKKIITFPKKQLTDEVYNAQSNYFKFLTNQGVVLPESIQVGNVFGSLEAKYPEPVNEKVDAAQIILLSTKKFLDKHTPAMEAQEFIEKEIDDHLVEPNPQDSTALGEVPEEPKKGSITPYRIRRYLSGYGYY
tara:strand:+ start:178 stop:750 length:573 start_codon:yes stop_codon:yes gene_type:complete